MALSHVFRFVWPSCLSFVQMSATPGEHGPVSAACFPSCGLEEACTTAAFRATPLPIVH